MIKKIFIYWDNNFQKAPLVIQKCLATWKLKNTSWEIIELDNSNLRNYIDIQLEISNLNKKRISVTSYSDIIRIFLLSKYGGCWCDSSTFCVVPLDNWLKKALNGNKFFAFTNNPPKGSHKKKILSSWFLYGEPNSYLIKKWKQAVIKYWESYDETSDYFWFHHLFTELTIKNLQFKKRWMNTTFISNKYSHFLKREGLMTMITLRVKKHIRSRQALIYKLTHKYDSSDYRKNCILDYLLGKLNLRFLHIPKNHFA